jgi:hypothetical protein
MATRTRKPKPATLLPHLPHLAGLVGDAPAPWHPNGNWADRERLIGELPRWVRTVYAAECARVVLGCFKREFPEDTRPAEAIEVAVGCARGTKEESAAWSAAKSAWSAAGSAWSAAGSAESAAKSAAWSAWSAAGSAAWSAWSAGSAESAAGSAQCLWNYLAYEGARGQWSADWNTSTVVALARGIFEELAFDRMPILADAIQDAGCDEPWLTRLRADGVFTRADLSLTGPLGIRDRE